MQNEARQEQYERHSHASAAAAASPRATAPRVTHDRAHGHQPQQQAQPQRQAAAQPPRGGFRIPRILIRAVAGCLKLGIQARIIYFRCKSFPLSANRTSLADLARHPFLILLLGACALVQLLFYMPDIKSWPGKSRTFMRLHLRGGWMLSTKMCARAGGPPHLPRSPPLAARRHRRPALRPRRAPSLPPAGLRRPFGGRGGLRECIRGQVRRRWGRPGAGVSADPVHGGAEGGGARVQVFVRLPPRARPPGERNTLFGRNTCASLRHS